MNRPAEVQVLRGSAKMKGPQTLCLVGSLALLISEFLQVGFQSFFSTFVVVLHVTGMVSVQGMALGGEKMIEEEGSRMNDGNLSVLVHHKDLLIKFLTLQKHNVAKLQAELLMACLSVTTAAGKCLTHRS